MRNLLLVFVGLLSNLIVAAQTHEAKSLKAANGESIGFYEFKPSGYSKSNKHPVIIFLHGIGERGNGTTELSKVLGVGIASDIKNGDKMTYTWNGKTESFIVLTPQLNSKYGNWQNFYVDELITYAVNVLGGDPNRIHLTGLSLGGGGTWNFAASTPERAKKLASIVPICGTCQSMNWANLTGANTAVWAFHAKNDGTVGVGCTTGHIYAINTLKPAVEPYMTLWDDGGHGVWDRVYTPENSYSKVNIYQWMLGQDRSKPVNKRPTIVANNISTTTDKTATLDASQSTDSDGKIVLYSWKQISGPNTAAISNKETSKANISGLAVGTYTFEVTVFDDRADWVTKEVTVTVTKGSGSANVAPTANAGSNQTITLPTNQVTLNGSSSKDSDGTITKYQWEKISGGAATIVSPSSANTQVTNLVQGTYTFRLTVTDNAGATGQATVNVVVNATSSGNTNKVFEVIAGSDQTIQLPTNSVIVDGSKSYDTRGSIKKWEWKRIAGPSQHTIANYQTAITTISNLVEGVYEFTLTIWDNNWTPSRDTLKVTVLKSTAQPTTGITKVDAGADFNASTSTITLDGSKSTDAKGIIKEYKWTKISGPGTPTITSPASAKTTVSNLTDGTYKFKLTIWDNAWVPYSDTVQVVVKLSGTSQPPVENPNPTPTTTTVNPGANRTLTLPTNSTVLDGSLSVDPKGSIKRWEWTKISGPSTYTLTNANTSKATASNLVRGTYQFLLTIWDNSWVPYSASVTIIVINSGDSVNIPTSPVVDAGADKTITLPTNSTTLDGSKSMDPRGVIKQYSWTKISGPNATITNASQAVATVSNLVAGTYKFKLTVWNNDWVPMADTVTINVVNSGAKIATLSATETTTNTTASLKLYPNPATTNIQIEIADELNSQGEIGIYSATGALVKQVNFNKTNYYQTQNISIADLSNGTYFARVNIGSTYNHTLTFIKQ